MTPVAEGVWVTSSVESAVRLSVCRMPLEKDLCAGHVTVGGGLNTTDRLTKGLSCCMVICRAVYVER